MRVIKTIFGRAGLLIVLVLLQLFWLGVVLSGISPYLTVVNTVLQVLSIFIVLHLINTSRNLSNDLLWILFIILVPIAGTVIYLYLRWNHRLTGRTYRSLKEETAAAARYYVQDPEVLSQAKEAAGCLAGQVHYLCSTTPYPIYESQGFSYEKCGEDGFPKMLAALKAAERFIFLEYFIINTGKMWDSILDILKEKAQAGLEVRLLYDDYGTINTLPVNYAAQLRSFGIKTQVFNPLKPFISGFMNNRDHRKIMVIDGKVAFSGGINLADEYINEIVRFGYWKDNITQVMGEAVWPFTVMFLTMWNALTHEDEDYTIFKTPSDLKRQKGWLIPYGDDPFDKQDTGRDVYLNIINQARTYCYIITPYLIIDNIISNALILAAERGVDVRIITPGIPDKRIVWRITRSYYPGLIAGGVKIYEYQPGFIHSKVMVADDVVATAGTANLDFRSLYLHFENGVYLLHMDDVKDIRDDCLEAMEQSKLMSPEDVKTGPVRTMIYMVLRLFAPML